MKKVTQRPQVEPEKLIAERINGWAAMMGFWAAIGAYLTTGQIIPGIVQVMELNPFKPLQQFVQAVYKKIPVNQYLRIPSLRVGDLLLTSLL